MLRVLFQVKDMLIALYLINCLCVKVFHVMLNSIPSIILYLYINVYRHECKSNGTYINELSMSGSVTCTSV